MEQNNFISFADVKASLWQPEVLALLKPSVYNPTPERLKSRAEKDVYKRQVWYNSEKCPPPHVIRSMTGAHVDYVITGIRLDGECCIASRKRALAIRRRSFLKLPFKSGKRVTCNVIAVGRAKALCTCGGFDVLLGTQDISLSLIHI